MLEWQSFKQRIRFQITLLTLFALSLVLLLAALGISTLSKTSENAEIIENIFSMNNTLQNVQITLETIRPLLRELARQSDPIEAEKMLSEIEEQISKMEGEMSNYTRIISGLLPDFQEEMNRNQQFQALFFEYRERVQALSKTVLEGNPEAVQRLLVEEDPLFQKMREQNQQLLDLNRKQAMARAHHSQNMIHNTILIQILCSVFAFLCFVIGFLSIRSLLSNASINSAMEGWARGQDFIDGKRNLGYDKARLLAEFAQQISDLKAVAYDLTKLTKEQR